MSRLTQKEIAYLAELQAVLDRCPPRLGFYTIGDSYLTVYDRTKEEKIAEIQDASRSGEFGGAVVKAKADFGVQVDFPCNIHSTAG